MPTSARNAGFIRVDVGIDPYDFFMIVSMVNSNLPYSIAPLPIAGCILRQFVVE